MNEGKLFVTKSCIKGIIYYRCTKFASGCGAQLIKKGNDMTLKESHICIKMILINWILQKLLQTQRASPILLYVKNPQDSNHIPIKFMKIYC
ncbi:hypothetical protein HZS_4000 [Henneguya salminicola]|nr:hypothetical protein HZS_4000 [Henneguya salminicola]